MQKTPALSFKMLKQHISIEQVLRHYNLFESLKLKGKSHRGPCPFCEGAHGTPFSVSLEKNCYQCFSCGTSGNILDFVAKWEGVNLPDAGARLTKYFVKDKEARVEVKKETPDPQPEKVTPSPPATRAEEILPAAPSVKEAHTSTPAAAHPEPPRANEPLTFALKNIEPQHPSVQALGFRDDILTAFGVGYYGGKGMMHNRIVIPIHNGARQLVVYAGFHPEERTYSYPPKFRKELELYNLTPACAAGDNEQDVILVQHPLEVVLLASSGHLNAMAIMGEHISKEQVDALLVAHGAATKVTLLWPTHADVVPTLSELFPHFFVRLRRFEAKQETPLGFTAEEVYEL